MIGLVSTYKEGVLAAEAVESLLDCCRVVLVQDGPIGEPGEGPDTDWGQFKKTGRVIVASGAWASDAEKRTALLHRTRRYGPGCWGIVLDGDEILVNGQYLQSMIEHTMETDRHAGSTSYNISLRIVEWDGSVAKIPARVLRCDLIDRYLLSSYNLQLVGSAISPALGNQPLLYAGEPDLPPVEGEFQKRRPLQGEPHLLHRSFLRSPRRKVQRQNAAEADGFARLVKDSTVAAAVGETARDERVGIWLPR